MADTIRTFIAVTVPLPEALRQVVAALRSMGRPIKPVNDDSTHVTLKFLGDVFDSRVPEIAAIVEDVASQHNAFVFNLVGLGAFPRIQRPSVVWAGMANAEPLTAMATELEERLELIGYDREKRPFRPHLTLARVRDKAPPALQELHNAHAGTEWGAVGIQSIELFQSELLPEGPRYTILNSAELQAS